MQLFCGGEEFLTKRDFNGTVDLLQGHIPQQKTYDTSYNGGLMTTDHEDRVLVFPILVAEGELIDVSFQPKASGGVWGYFFTSTTDNNIPNSMIFMSDWLSDTFKSLVVPANAKYFGVCIGSSGVTSQNWTQKASLSVTTKKSSVNALSRLVNDTVLTPSSLASIMGKVPVTVDLSAKAVWSNSTFSVDAGSNTLHILKDRKDRLMAFPIALPNCQEINVKIDLVSKGKWEYFFTKSPTDDIPNDCFGDPNWRTTATENIKVPDGAKYMAINLGLTDNTNISQASDAATTMQFLAKTTLGSFLLAGSCKLADSGEIMQFD